MSEDIDKEIEYIRTHDALSEKDKKQMIADLEDRKRQMALGEHSAVSSGEIYPHPEFD